MYIYIYTSIYMYIYVKMLIYLLPHCIFFSNMSTHACVYAFNSLEQTFELNCQIFDEL